VKRRPNLLGRGSVRPLVSRATGSVRRVAARALVEFVPEIAIVLDPDVQWHRLMPQCVDSDIDPTARLYPPYSVWNSQVGRFTYVAENAVLTHTTVGRFCSLGPNLMCGWGVHPTRGLSTAPMFYSTKAQNGFTLSAVDKVDETKPIVIGHDVFIGSNVVVLDGVTIGDGAVIGAGAVVATDIPPYAIAVGVPAGVARYRFEPDVIERLLATRWWEFDLTGLADVERHFWDVEAFLDTHSPR
jgi:virginiamycin A acetyltransferase